MGHLGMVPPRPMERNKVKEHWPLKEQDITQDLCKRCGLCCSMDIRPQWADKRMMEALRTMVEKSPDVTFLGDGIRIKCSYLRQTKHAETPEWECSIYEDRPQLCEDFNCVSWAKASNNRTQYEQVLEKAKEFNYVTE